MIITPNVIFSTQTQPATQKYNLSIEVYFSNQFTQKLNLPFNGKDSIGKVKAHIASLLGTVISKQKWSGWPILPNGDETTLQSCGITENTPLKINIDTDQKILKNPRLKPECYKSFAEASLNNSRIDEVCMCESFSYLSLL